MEIFINSISHLFESKVTLSQVVVSLNLPSQGVAIAVNKNVVTQSEWDNYYLQDQDQVLVIGATQGG